jgi:hypothetical protein
MTIRRRPREKSRVLFFGALACAVVGCGGSVAEPPSSVEHRDTGTPDAAADAAPPDADGGHPDARPLDAGQCRVDADCVIPGDTPCVAPGMPYGSGPCANAAPCVSDGECRLDGGNMICDVSPDVCPGIPKSCIPGCTGPADCGAGQVCTAGRCAGAPCQNDATCPTDFACAGGACARKTCSDDTPCSGYCVQSACYSEPGWCPQQIAP